MNQGGTMNQVKVTYRGYGGYEGTRVTVQRDDGRVPEWPEEPLPHHVRHSPTGFAWGYAGSGPAELARCILIDYLELHDEVEQDPDAPLGVSYQDFKFAFVAHWPWHGAEVRSGPGPAWELTGDDIGAWLANQLDAIAHAQRLYPLPPERRARINERLAPYGVQVPEPEVADA